MKNQNSFNVSELEQVKGFEFMQVLILVQKKGCIHVCLLLKMFLLKSMSVIY